MVFLCNDLYMYLMCYVNTGMTQDERWSTDGLRVMIKG